MSENTNQPDTHKAAENMNARENSNRSTAEVPKQSFSENDAVVDQDKPIEADSIVKEPPSQAQDVSSAQSEPGDEIARLKQLLDSHHSQMLMAMAETENIRKRTQVEIENAHKFALERFAKDLLSVADSLELALDVKMDEAEQDWIQNIKQGIELTSQQFHSVLNKYAIVQITPALGDELDPKQHQSIGVLPCDDIAPHAIARVIQKGYTLSQRLIRPAMVLTAVALQSDSASSQSKCESEQLASDPSTKKDA